MKNHGDTVASVQKEEPGMWQREMADELKAARPRERRAILERYGERTGYTPQSLYAIARECGFDAGRRRRADLGECVLTDMQVEFVAALIHTSSRENKGAIKPVACALEEAIDAGVIERGAVSEGRMQQLLAARLQSKKSLDAETPHTPLRSLHPNHVHEIDVSVCIQYYVKNGDTAIIDEKLFYKNKPQNYDRIKTRLLRYVITDHFSGAFFFYYYDAAGESQNNLYDFSIRAWEKKADKRFPFRGVPFLVLWDRGSANTSKAIQAFCERLGISFPEGMPHNPRRQGQVESTHNIIEEWFESKLRIQPAHTVEDLNRWALDYAIWHNAMRNHTRHGMKRTECWLLITREQLRELPEREILQELYAYDDEKNTRLVGGDYSISFKLGSKGDEEGRPFVYYLKHIPGILPTRTRVLVRIKPYVWPVVDIVFNEQVYEVRPTPRLPSVQGGFRSDAAIIGEEYKAQPETLTQQAVKRMETLAYGDAVASVQKTPFAGMEVMGHHADKLGSVVYLPKRGTPVEVERSVADKEIPFIEFLKRLSAAHGPISKDVNRALREKYGDAVDAAEAEKVIRTFTTEGAEIIEKGGETKAEAV